MPRCYRRGKSTPLLPLLSRYFFSQINKKKALLSLGSLQVKSRRLWKGKQGENPSEIPYRPPFRNRSLKVYFARYVSSPPLPLDFFLNGEKTHDVMAACPCLPHSIQTLARCQVPSHLFNGKWGREGGSGINLPPPPKNHLLGLGKGGQGAAPEHARSKINFILFPPSLCAMVRVSTKKVIYFMVIRNGENAEREINRIAFFYIVQFFPHNPVFRFVVER